VLDDSGRHHVRAVADLSLTWTDAADFFLPLHLSHVVERVRVDTPLTAAITTVDRG
jgi:hypothetical protein